jgi:hypothetical protein
VAALGRWLFFLDDERMRLRERITTRARNLPADLLTRVSPGDREAALGDPLGHVKVRRRGSQRSQLVAEVFIDGLKPLGKLDNRFALGV